MAGTAVEDGVLDCLERGPAIIAETNAHGVGPTVGDERVGRCNSIENRGGILRNFFGSEAEAGRHNGIDLDNALDLADGIADSGAELIQRGRVVREDFDLDRLGCIGQIVNHVLKDLGEFDVQLRFGGFDLGADIGHDLVDGAAAFGLELHRKVALVGFSDRNQAQLHPRSA